MKKILLTAIALAGFAFSTNASAQMSSMTNCSALSGTPLVCVKNNTSFPVVAIQAYDGMSFGGNWIQVPGGVISPGGTTVVRFPVYTTGCMKNVVIKTMTGATHVYQNVDVCHTVSFLVNGW
jgi:hypothetical protein